MAPLGTVLGRRERGFGPPSSKLITLSKWRNMLTFRCRCLLWGPTAPCGMGVGCISPVRAVVRGKAVESSVSEGRSCLLLGVGVQLFPSVDLWPHALCVVVKPLFLAQLRTILWGPTALAGIGVGCISPVRAVVQGKAVESFVSEGGAAFCSGSASSCFRQLISGLML